MFYLFLHAETPTRPVAAAAASSAARDSSAVANYREPEELIDTSSEDKHDPSWNIEEDLQEDSSSDMEDKKTSGG